MHKHESISNHYPELWNESSFLKIGALSLIAGGLFDANAVVHFAETGITSAQGAIALVLGGLAFRASAGAFSEAYHLSQDEAYPGSPDYYGDE